MKRILLLIIIFSPILIFGQNTRTSQIRDFDTGVENNTKVAGIEAGAEVNVKADWNEANSESDAFISNKPDVVVFGDTVRGGEISSQFYVDSLINTANGGWSDQSTHTLSDYNIAIIPYTSGESIFQVSGVNGVSAISVKNAPDSALITTPYNNGIVVQHGSEGRVGIHGYINPSFGPLYYFPSSDGTSGQVMTTNGSGSLYWSAGGGGGSGTVTNFSAGNLSPLFTTSVANSTTTPALSFNLSNAPATYRVYASSGTTTPAFVSLTDDHIPNTITASNYLLLTGGTLTGKLNTKATSTASASINLPHGTAPTSPVNGDLWTTTGGVFARVNGVTVDISSSGGSGVNSVTFPSTGGLFNFGTSSDVNGILDFSNLNDAAMATGDYVAFTDISSGTSPLAVRRETVSDMKKLLSPTVKESDGSPSYSNIETIEFSGATVSQPSANTARVTIQDTRKQTTPQSITTTANASTYLNFYTTASTDKTITFSNLADGDSGQIEVLYSGTAKITFSHATYTINISSNIYDSAGTVAAKTSGVAIYSYYVRNSNIYINGTQIYN